MTGHDELRTPIANSTTGGSSETEVSEVAHRPTGRSAPAVITATPLAWWRSTDLSRSGATPEAAATLR
jgi:hypothetical protein